MLLEHLGAHLHAGIDVLCRVKRDRRRVIRQIAGGRAVLIERRHAAGEAHIRRKHVDLHHLTRHDCRHVVFIDVQLDFKAVHVDDLRGRLACGHHAALLDVQPCHFTRDIGLNGFAALQPIQALAFFDLLVLRHIHRAHLVALRGGNRLHALGLDQPVKIVIGLDAAQRRLHIGIGHVLRLSGNHHEPTDHGGHDHENHNPLDPFFLFLHGFFSFTFQYGVYYTTKTAFFPTQCLPFSKTVSVFTPPPADQTSSPRRTSKRRSCRQACRQVPLRQTQRPAQADKSTVLW